MTSKDKKSSTRQRGNPPPVQRDEQALLRALVAQATRRGETLATVAKTLGVSYERLAQWRRGEADIRHAQTSVHENAAQYLGLPTVLVLVLAGVFRVEQFVWPAHDELPVRLERELERLRQHPFLGGFVPPQLTSAEPAVKLFVAFLFHELSAEPAGVATGYRWLNALHQATVGNVQTQAEQDALRNKARPESPLF